MVSFYNFLPLNILLDLETILYINDSVDDTTEIKTEEESNDSTFKRYCEKYNDSNIRII